MAEGYVYILVNSAFRDLVKIGKTTKDPSERARELSQTGTPFPFLVAYSVYVSDCDALERALHELFSEQRANNDREFFRMPVNAAVDALREHAESLLLEEGASESTVSSKNRDRFYMFRVVRASAHETAMTFSKSVADNPVALDALQRRRVLHERSEHATVTLLPGLTGYELYRFGFTSIRDNDELVSAIETVVSALGDPVWVETSSFLFDECAEFDWRKALDSPIHKESLLSFSDQLYFGLRENVAMFAARLKLRGQEAFIKSKTASRDQKSGKEKVQIERLK